MSDGINKISLLFLNANDMFDVLRISLQTDFELFQM